jgi:hypothetical protein
MGEMLAQSRPSRLELCADSKEAPALTVGLWVAPVGLGVARARGGGIGALDAFLAGDAFRGDGETTWSADAVKRCGLSESSFFGLIMARLAAVLFINWGCSLGRLSTDSGVSGETKAGERRAGDDVTGVVLAVATRAAFARGDEEVSFGRGEMGFWLILRHDVSMGSGTTRAATEMELFSGVTAIRSGDFFSNSCPFLL